MAIRLHGPGAHFAEQKALGNLGWLITEWRHRQIVFFFQQAADEARNLTAKSDLLKWVRALDLSPGGEPNAVAKSYYKQSLALAQQSEDKEDLVDAMTDLAAVSVEQQEWNQAIRTANSGQSLPLPGRPCRRARRPAGGGKIAAHQNDAARASQLFREVAADGQSEIH